MPVGKAWSRHHPIIVQPLVRQVVSENASMLFSRDYEGLYRKYVEAAKEKQYRIPQFEGFKAIVTRNLLKWEEKLKNGERLS